MPRDLLGAVPDPCERAPRGRVRVERATVLEGEGELLVAQGRPHARELAFEALQVASGCPRYADSVAQGEALLAFGLHRLHGADDAVAIMNLSTKSDLDEAAANLFGYLRALDAKGAKTIAVMPIPNEGLGEAINDRLRRAAVGRD